MTSLSPGDVPALVADAIARYDGARRRLADATLAGADSLDIAARLTDVTDRLVQTLWRHAAPSPAADATALVALGGYGRRELAFGSDIDLVVELGDPELLETDALRDGVERWMTWCREAGLDLAHAVRTPAQTRRQLHSDPRTPVALLDARLIADDTDASVWDGVRADQACQFLSDDDHGVGFVDLLWQGYQARRERNGKSVYLLEPDIKSGEGGLRDLNCIRWAGLVRWGFCAGHQARPAVGWSAEFQAGYQRGLRWLMRLRHLLHLEHQRAHDRLSFPDQEYIADIVFRDVPADDPGSPAEALMRRHYREARAISMLAQRLLRRWKNRSGDADRAELAGPVGIAGGQLVLDRDALDRATPDRATPDRATPDRSAPSASGAPKRLRADQVMDALRQASAHDVLLDPLLEISIADSVDAWPKNVQHDAQLGAELRELLTDPTTSEKTSHRLLENGIIGALIPEFKPIVCHCQHDVYHVYTTDIHSLKCLEKARQLVAGSADPDDLRWPLFADVAAQIERVDVFLLAALFHDIGKNRGGDHSRRGAELVADVGRRLGLGDADTDQLAFLVREHLTLSDTARRRDLSDPRVVRDLAGRIRSVETLNALTALTFCDMSTVGPDVMTDWNATLIAELYNRLRHAIESGLESVWRDRQSSIDAQRRAILAMLEDDADAPVSSGERRSQLDAFIRDIPADHIATTPPEALCRQFETDVHARCQQRPALRFTPLVERGATEIIVSAPDVPGALAKIAGVIAASSLNILAAEIVTTASRRTLDIFQVTQAAPRASLVSTAQPHPPADRRRLDRLNDKLVAVLNGDVEVESLLNQRISEARLAPRPTPPVSTWVDVRQDVSDSATVVEIRAPDRLGLLYEIADTLHDHHISTHLAKIDSLGTQIIDTFYVEDAHGAKLSAAAIAELANALYEDLTSSPMLDGRDDQA